MIWKYADVDDQKKYKLGLCQASDGSRYIRLIDIDQRPESMVMDEVCLITECVNNELLKMRNLRMISNSVKIQNGESFYVDGHGIWYTELEKTQIASGLKYADISWIKGVQPKFPPK